MKSLIGAGNEPTDSFCKDAPGSVMHGTCDGELLRGSCVCRDGQAGQKCPKWGDWSRRVQRQRALTWDNSDPPEHFLPTFVSELTSCYE